MTVKIVVPVAVSKWLAGFTANPRIPGSRKLLLRVSRRKYAYRLSRLKP
jgi:hypothetical protein